MKEFHRISELVAAAEKENKKISDIVLAQQSQAMDTTEAEILAQMEAYFDIMVEGTHKSDTGSVPSASGLTGDEGWKVKEYNKKEDGGLCGHFVTQAIANGLTVSNCNAAMGKIVATPTAGSCGILPGCLVTLYEEKGVEKEAIARALCTAAAFGMVIAEHASIAGASGGCQAECGSASAMAAAAVVEIMGGSPQQVADACGMSIINQMGLVCDPVAGLVEIPCIKRNASGTTIALTSATMALAGVPLYIPVDECIEVMKNVGDVMVTELKETAKGGLATSPTGQQITQRFKAGESLMGR